MCLARGRGTSVLMGELASLAVLLVLTRALDLTAPTRDTVGLEEEEEVEELPGLDGGSRPCDLRRLLLIGRIFSVTNCCIKF